MKALTIWQPWASLIMAGAKPYEFRRWAAPKFVRDQRIVIHAGARPARRSEIAELLVRLRAGGFNETGVKPEIAIPLLERWHIAPRSLPHASGLGTGIIGRPRRASRIFVGIDSNRIDHGIWAWPLTDVQPFEPIVPARGLQGFWEWGG